MANDIWAHPAAAAAAAAAAASAFLFFCCLFLCIWVGLNVLKQSGRWGGGGFGVLYFVVGEIRFGEIENRN